MSGLVVALSLLILAYFTGTRLERQHFKRILERERQSEAMVVTTFETMPADWQADEARLVTGNVVISADYFKRFLASLRAFFGGRIKSYEPLLDRARREAVLRMKDDAKKRGFDTVINVRLETSRIANSVGDDGTAGVEILAFGTAIKRLANPSETPSLEIPSLEKPDPLIG